MEVLQLVLDLGRVTSVDDVLVDALGAALTSVFSLRWWRSRVSPTSTPRSPAAS